MKRAFGILICIELFTTLPHNIMNARIAGSFSAGSVKDSIYDKVDEPAEFPGGTGAYIKFLKEHLKFPPECEATGMLKVSFIVQKDGTITSAKVKKSSNAMCDIELIKVLASMPKWKPGKIDHRAVACRVNFSWEYSGH